MEDKPLVSILKEVVLIALSLKDFFSAFRIFDDMRRQEATHLYEHSFTGHALKVTDVVIGYGGSNAIIVSASEDRTCKVCHFLFSSSTTVVSGEMGKS